MSLSVNLQHSFEGFELNAEFTAPQGLTVLFGASGSGKTTIVNAIAGLLRPMSGRISLDEQLLLDTGAGINLPSHKRKLGYIFQEGRLFPHLTVRQNLLYGRWFSGAKQESPDFNHTVELLGVEHLLDRRPATLSGGEKQRVAIGRALLAAPAMILADEPLASLDAARKAEILPCFERLRDESSIPIVYVSHSATEVARLATTVVALQEGAVMGQGTAAEVLGDPTLMPLGVRSAGAVLETRIAAQHEDGLTELSAAGISLFVPRLEQAEGTSVRVRIPAQEVILSLAPPVGLSALNVIKGRIEAVREGAGPGAMVSVATNAGRLLARVTQRSVATLNLSPGRDCYAIIKTVAIAPEDIGA
ncbi:MAG: molybdenum ABC transporter ATP-binding protein [Pseudomonadales bacterium]